MPYTTRDTIVALSTPFGRSGIGVVRLSGPASLNIACAIFRGREPLDTAASHTLHHGTIVSDGQDIDDALVSVMRAPRTYTGEDVVEISCHGSPVVLSRVIDACVASGARIASPGEFTFRAYLSGRMDLAEAEAVQGLIASGTTMAARASLDQLRGGLSRRVGAFRERLVELLALIEAGLDHPEDDIPPLAPAEATSRADTLAAEIAALAATADRGRFLADGMRVAIIGKPNTGKSSLLNALLDRDRAIVTDIPGTTRDVLEETLDIAGVPVIVMDTAGIREHAADAAERIGQERARACITAADVILWVLDAAAPLSGEDLNIARLIARSGKARATMPILNKSDLPQQVPASAVADCLPGSRPALAVSASTRDGMEGLERSLALCADAGPSPSASLLVTNARHRAALDQAASALRRTARAARDGDGDEITALHAREALDALGEITGETATDEILENIFSKFCIGK